MIHLQPAIDWPVPYLHRATISAGSVKGRCGHCRQIRPIRFVFYGLNVAKGPKHGGWYRGHHEMECDQCIDDFINQRADVRSVIKDERGNA